MLGKLTEDVLVKRAEMERLAYKGAVRYLDVAIKEYNEGVLGIRDMFDRAPLPLPTAIPGIEEWPRTVKRNFLIFKSYIYKPEYNKECYWCGDEPDFFPLMSPTETGLLFGMNTFRLEAWVCDSSECKEVAGKYMDIRYSQIHKNADELSRSEAFTNLVKAIENAARKSKSTKARPRKE